MLFSVISWSYASRPNNFFNALSGSQEELLNHLNPGTFRFVFEENSIPATDDISIFLDYYHNYGPFILESIPAHFNDYKENQTHQITKPNKFKFVGCYSIFYFQDQLFTAIAGIKDISPEMILWVYFYKFAVQVRKENPSYDELSCKSAFHKQ